MPEEDAAANAWAVTGGARILSAYAAGGAGDDARLWVVTEADRSATTVLRPDEY